MALGGTALTGLHCTMLRRYTTNVATMLDGDASGVKMAKKIQGTLKDERFSARNIKLPLNMDPDEYLEQHGKERVLKLIGKSFNF